jgi:hypothetical protein
VAITLGLKAEDAIRYHQEYFMLLGCTEFTRIYLQIKDNPWPFVNLVKLTQNSGMSNSEIVELLKIANGYLPRVRLEYDRAKAELSSVKAEITNSVRIYQQFCDKNLDMNKRINELQVTINESESKKVELHNTVTALKQQLSELQESDIYNLNPENRLDIVMNDGRLPPTTPKETLDYSTPPILTLNGSSETLPHIQGNRKILDTRELSHLETAIDKEFQVYPELKEKTSESSIWPRDE